MANPVIDNTGASNSAVSQGNITLASFVVASNSYILVVVGWDAGTVGTVTGVTFGGSSTGVTKLGGTTRSGIWGIDLWGIVVTSGTTADIVATFNGTKSNIVIGASSWLNVDINGTPAGTPVVGSGSINSASVTVTGTTSGNVVVDGIFTFTTTPTMNGAQTQIFKTVVNATDTGGSSYKSSAGGSVSMTWTVGSGDDWAMAAVELKAAPAATDTLMGQIWT